MGARDGNGCGPSCRLRKWWLAGWVDGWSGADPGYLSTEGMGGSIDAFSLLNSTTIVMSHKVYC